MQVRRRLRVSGRVQNVWFRDSTRSEAERLGLAGWVRNLADGRVEIEVEGGDAPVAELVAWTHHGPPRAEVVDVGVVEIEVAGGRGFRIRPDAADQGPP